MPFRRRLSSVEWEELRRAAASTIEEAVSVLDQMLDTRYPHEERSLFMDALIGRHLLALRENPDRFFLLGLTDPLKRLALSWAILEQESDVDAIRFIAIRDVRTALWCASYVLIRAVKESSLDVDLAKMLLLFLERDILLWPFGGTSYTTMGAIDKTLDPMKDGRTMEGNACLAVAQLAKASYGGYAGTWDSVGRIRKLQTPAQREENLVTIARAILARRRMP